MAKKEAKNSDRSNSPNHSAIHNTNHNGNNHLPAPHQKLTLGQRAADKLTQFGGSWFFIALFCLFLLVWIVTNGWFLVHDPFDPYPFILLNLFLSTLAAIQAPVILMSQNRLAERDRLQVKYDYQVNRKAEREIQLIYKELKRTQEMILQNQKKQ